MSSNVDAPKMAAIRAVFTAMFDAVDAAGDFDEGRWVDLIAAFNATGRLVFGWPHLESSESDIFGALDDIAVQLEGTKAAMEQTASEARFALFELHQALDPLLPDDDPGREEQTAPIEAAEPAETELSEPPSTNSSVPRADEMLERTGTEEVEEREERGPYVKEQPAKDVAAYYETHTKAETAAHFGISESTVVRRVREWESATGDLRRAEATPHTPLRVVDSSEQNDSQVDKFERRAAQAADRTWQERHGSA